MAGPADWVMAVQFQLENRGWIGLSLCLALVVVAVVAWACVYPVSHRSKVGTTFYGSRINRKQFVTELTQVFDFEDILIFSPAPKVEMKRGGLGQQAVDYVSWNRTHNNSAASLWPENKWSVDMRRSLLPGIWEGEIVRQWPRSVQVIDMPGSAGRSGAGIIPMHKELNALRLIKYHWIDAARKNESSLYGMQGLGSKPVGALRGSGLILGLHREFVGVQSALFHFLNCLSRCFGLSLSRLGVGLAGGSILLSSIGIDASDVSLIGAYRASKASNSSEHTRKADQSPVKFKLLIFVLLITLLGLSGLILKIIEAFVKNGNPTFVVNYAMIVGLLIAGQFVCYLLPRRFLG